jgi:hypothetical protein
MSPTRPATFKVDGVDGRDRVLKAAIFDVDGVLLASTRERAWREALTGFAEPAGFTTAIYQAEVAGKQRLDGARAALAARASRTPMPRPAPTPRRHLKVWIGPAAERASGEPMAVFVRGERRELACDQSLIVAG